ncbi:MAG: YCF48-related protein [Pyrinomonadaceae bacterium]
MSSANTACSTRRAVVVVVERKSRGSLRVADPSLALGGSFNAAGRGWLVGAGATLLQAVDAGETWREQKIAELENIRLNAITFVNERHGWAVGAGGFDRQNC